MTTEDMKRVVTAFVNTVRLPTNYYKVSISETNTTMEIQLIDDNALYYDIVVDSSSIHILYNTEYEQEALYTETFTTSVRLFYLLSTIYYMAVAEKIDMAFLDFLSILLEEDINDWQSLVAALADNLKLQAERQDDIVILQGKKLSMDLDVIEYDDMKYKVDSDSFSSVIEMFFNIVEYAAILVNRQDNLFSDYQTDNIGNEDSDTQNENNSNNGNKSNSHETSDEKSSNESENPSPEAEDNNMPSGAVAPDEEGL